MNDIQLIARLWQLFDEQKWDKAKELFHPNFVAVWPQSKERIIGPSNFINVNQHYPGNHRIEVVRIHDLGKKVVSTVWIVADTGQKTFANSYFDLQEGLIVKAEEYWAEPYEAPNWRSKWVEHY